MPPRADPTATLDVHPLTPDRWPDLERLFGPNGGCGGCWCMWWRLTRPEIDAGKGEGNRAALERYVRAGNVPGLLAYADGDPVGWIALEPRAAYSRLARSPILAPIDDAPVWSVTCFFVARPWRRRGLTRRLVAAAADHARRAGARVLEAYPVDSAKRIGDATMYHGAASTLRALGFEEVARRAPTRPVMRLTLGRRRAPAARGRARARSTRRSSPTPRSASPRGR